LDGFSRKSREFAINRDTPGQRIAIDADFFANGPRYECHHLAGGTGSVRIVRSSADLSEKLSMNFQGMTQKTVKPLLVSKGWIQAVVLVMLFGFFVMGMLAYYTYTDEPPIPARVVNENGTSLFDGHDIIAGQQIFLKNGLMEYGSIFGHGAWLGPDFTTDY
jgi:hypothetical protein